MKLLNQRKHLIIKNLLLLSNFKNIFKVVKLFIFAKASLFFCVFPVSNFAESFWFTYTQKSLNYLQKRDLFF